MQPVADDGSSRVLRRAAVAEQTLCQHYGRANGQRQPLPAPRATSQQHGSSRQPERLPHQPERSIGRVADDAAEQRQRPGQASSARRRRFEQQHEDAGDSGRDPAHPGQPDQCARLPGRRDGGCHHQQRKTETAHQQRQRNQINPADDNAFRRDVLVDDRRQIACIDGHADAEAETPCRRVTVARRERAPRDGVNALRQAPRLYQHLTRVVRRNRTAGRRNGCPTLVDQGEAAVHRFQRLREPETNRVRRAIQRDVSCRVGRLKLGMSLRHRYRNEQKRQGERDQTDTAEEYFQKSLNTLALAPLPQAEGRMRCG